MIVDAVHNFPRVVGAILHLLGRLPSQPHGPQWTAIDKPPWLWTAVESDDRILLAQFGHILWADSLGGKTKALLWHVHEPRAAVWNPDTRCFDATIRTTGKRDPSPKAFNRSLRPFLLHISVDIRKCSQVVCRRSDSALQALSSTRRRPFVSLHLAHIITDQSLNFPESFNFRSSRVRSSGTK